MCNMARRIASGEAVEIGLRVKRARVARAMTLKQVAARCGGDYTQVSKIERGKFSSMNRYVQTVCKELGVDPTSADDASPQALHARLDRLIREKPVAARALQAVFDALDRLAN